MKFLKGYRKNYFSLSAITMFATAKKLVDKETYIKSNIDFNHTLELKEEESFDETFFIQATISKEEDLSSLYYIYNLLNPLGTAPPKLFIYQLKQYKYIRRDI